MRKLFIIVSCLFLPSGCSLFQSNTSLIKPPELPVKQQEVKKAILEYIPSNAEWVSASNDEEANKIIEIDWDNDKKNEMMVFYKLPDQTAQIEAVLLKQSDGNWKKISHIKELGRKINKFEFTDLNHDGIKELLVGFAFSEMATDKALIIYDLAEDKPKKVMEHPYAAFFSGDYTGDGRGNLLLSTLIPNQEHTIRLYQFNNDKEKKLDELSLDPFVYPYYNTASGLVTPSLKGIMLDAGLGAHSSTSFIIGVNDGKLVHIIPDGYKEEDLFRAYFAQSQDSDQDGVIEFPLLVEAGQEGLPYSEMPFIHQYYQLDDQARAGMVKQYYRNVNYQYKIEVPADWPPISIVESKDKHYVKFISTKNQETLFDVFVIDKGKSIPNGWNPLYQSNQFTFLTKFTSKKEKALFHPSL